MTFDVQHVYIYQIQGWVMINKKQLEHTFWSLTVLKDLPQVSLTSMQFISEDKEFVSKEACCLLSQLL